MFFFFQAEDGIRDSSVTGVQTCALFFSSRRRHTRFKCDWSSDVCSSDLSAPAYPLEEVIDPTGAGDAFAGGLLGYLATVEPQQDGYYSIDEIKRGVVHGNIIGSFVCEDFSIDRLRSLAMDDVAERYQCLVMCSHFDPNSCPGEPGQAQTISRRGVKLL